MTDCMLAPEDKRGDIRNGRYYIAISETGVMGVIATYQGPDPSRPLPLIVQIRIFKKNLNVSKPSEHHLDRGKICQSDYMRT